MFDFERYFIFSVDKMLAFLVKKLRILGFDVYLRQDDDDLFYFIEKSIIQNRFLITSSFNLLTTVLDTKRYKHYFDKIIFVNFEAVNKDSIIDLIKYVFSFLFKFYNLENIKYKELIDFIYQNELSRCLICNFKVVLKDNNLYYCANCDKYYWEGSHHRNINFFIDSVIYELSDFYLN
jgi:uncharacterized protein with PIN domain